MQKELVVGQSWYFDEQQEVFLYILRTEELVPNVKFCHIAIEGTEIKGPDGKMITTIGHLPFEYQAVLDAVTVLRNANDVLPDFEDGYQQWRSEFDKGKAGVYNIPVAKSIELIKEVFNR
jgi:hypothetical protein